MKSFLYDRLDLYKLMKVTLSQLAIALAISGVSYASKGKAQNVLQQHLNLSVKNVELKSALNKLSAAVSVKFVYSKDIINANQIVSIEAHDELLQTVLDNLLTKNNIHYELVNNDIVLEKQATADPVKKNAPGEVAVFTVTGTVKSSKGETLPGVSVTVKGATMGTTTDVDGKFTIIAPDGSSTLVFSYIGFTTLEMPINNTANLAVVLQDDVRQIGEVVVTALGIKRSSRELGYATQQINGKDLTAAKPTNLATGLSGKIAGLQVIQANNQIDAGDQVRVVLRGNRSFAGNNEALLVLDGVVAPLSYLNSINPNDVENVNVLKGANAAALYGSEASNGVLIVTTKRGKKGIDEVTYTNTTSLNQLSYFPKAQDQFGGGSGQDAFGFPVFTPYENQNFGDRFDGSTRTIGRTLPDGTTQMVPYVSQIDDKKKFFDTGVDEQNDLSFTSGNDNGSTYFNIQRLNSKGYVPGDKSNRTAVRLNGTRNYNHFRLDYTANYTQRNIDKSNAQIFDNILNTPAEIPLSKYSDINSEYGNLNNYFNDYGLNPYFALQQSRNTERRDDFLGSLALSYDVAPWLNLTAKGGINTSTRNGKNINSAFDYSDFAVNSGKAIASPQDRPGGESDYSNFVSRMEGSFLATFKKKISDFTTSFVLGTQVIQESTRSLSVGTSFLVIPDFYNISYRSGDATVAEADTKDRRVGAFGDLTLGYKNYLFLHASGRNDWDSRLSAENRSFFYPSVDASWVFTEAIPSLADSRILNYGKLRAGISKVYAVQFSPYSLQSTFDVGNGFPYGSTAGYSVGNTVYAPDLKPEETVSKEIGLELGFLNNRLSLETSAYWETTSNQEILNGINISNATGYTNAVINTGSGENHGVELSVKGTPILSNNSHGVTWNIGVNYSYNQNKAISLYQGLPNLSIGNMNYIVKGDPYPVLMGNGFQTDGKGHTVVNATSGYPVLSQTNILFGQTTPKDILGVSTSVSYHHFTFAGTAEYRDGSVVYNGSGSTGDFAGVSYGSATNGRERFVYPNSVIQTAPGVYVPNTNITTNSGGIDYWAGSTTRYGVAQNYVTSAAFIKIRELSIGYDVPADYLKRIKFIKRANFALVGRNLFMFRPKTNPYTDPEFNNTLDNAQGANGLNQTPPTRIYGFTASFTL